MWWLAEVVCKGSHAAQALERRERPRLWLGRGHSQGPQTGGPAALVARAAAQRELHSCQAGALSVEKS